MDRRESIQEKARKRRQQKKRQKVMIRRSIALCVPILLIGLIIFILFSDKKETAQPKKSQPVSGQITTTEGAPEDTKEPTVTTATILSSGDVILHSPFISSSVYKTADGSYDYSAIFDYIKSEYELADFCITNLELTISNGNYSGYPLFRSPATIATALKQSSVDMCLLGNNHIYDNGDKGLTLTMDALDANELLYTGVQKSAQDKTYHIQDINGIKVGIFNYVYETGEYSPSRKLINGNHVSSASADLINTFHYQNLDAMYDEIEDGLAEMKDAGVEYTIAYIHWGTEYQTTENAQQNQIAQKLCNLGINALIGGHPHVIQPIDLLTSNDGEHQMLCVYSMGNHLSNQNRLYMDSMPTGHTEDGLMVKLTLEKVDDGPVVLKAADFIPTWVYYTRRNGGSEYFILPLHNRDQIIADTSSLSGSASGIDESLNRTNAIIGEGVEKVQAALPLK